MSEFMELPGPLDPEWRALDAAGNRHFNNRVADETPRGHALWREPFRSVARTVIADAVIIELPPKVRGRWAIVRLSDGEQSSDVEWRGYSSFESWDDCAAAARQISEEALRGSVPSERWPEDPSSSE